MLDVHPLHEDVRDERVLGWLGRQVRTEHLTLETLINQTYINQLTDIQTFHVESDLDVQLDDDGVGPGEGDELGQGGADHGLPGHGGPQPRGEQRRGDQPRPALVCRIVCHGVQALHLVARERRVITWTRYERGE